MEECVSMDQEERRTAVETRVRTHYSGAKLDWNIASFLSEFPLSKVLISVQYVQEEMIMASDEVNNIFNMCMCALAAWLGLLLEGKEAKKNNKMWWLSFAQYLFGYMLYIQYVTIGQVMTVDLQNCWFSLLSCVSFCLCVISH